MQEIKDLDVKIEEEQLRIHKLSMEEIKSKLQGLDKQLLELNNSRRRLLLSCPHDWEYHPDPSGNNDSSYTCRICHEGTRTIP